MVTCLVITAALHEIAGNTHRATNHLLKNTAGINRWSSRGQFHFLSLRVDVFCPGAIYLIIVVTCWKVFDMNEDIVTLLSWFLILGHLNLKENVNKNTKFVFCWSWRRHSWPNVEIYGRVVRMFDPGSKDTEFRFLSYPITFSFLFFHHFTSAAWSVYQRPSSVSIACDSCTRPKRPLASAVTLNEQCRSWPN
jgi:hypothetical protein